MIDWNHDMYTCIYVVLFLCLCIVYYQYVLVLVGYLLVHINYYYV